MMKAENGFRKKRIKMERKTMKRNDILLVGILLLIGLLAVGIYLVMPKESGEQVVVWIEGKEYARYDLNQELVVELPGALGNNTLTIQDGTVWMSDAVCPDKYCVRQGKIQYNRESITCLPGRIVITIEGGEESEIDIIGQ